PEMDWSPDEPVQVEELRQHLDVVICRNPASRFSFIRQAHGILLFVDGACFECDEQLAPLAEQMCAMDHIRIDPGFAASDPAMELVAALMNQGSLAFDGQD